MVVQIMSAIRAQCMLNRSLKPRDGATFRARQIMAAARQKGFFLGFPLLNLGAML